MDELSGTTTEGLVIAHLGQGIAVEHDGQIILCQPLRKLDTITVGDKVLWSLTAPGQGRIEAVQPRRSLLARPSRNNKIRPVAANIDTLYVVIAVEPPCDFLLVDQYLAVCESSNINVALILNKVDLPQPAAFEKELSIYQTIGYNVYPVSSQTGQGMEELRQMLKNQVSILSGQSGVGKSSITNSLLPEQSLKTNTISAISKLGRHTTTAATLYHIATGGDLIDSPGVSIFGLADLDRASLSQGYREFQAYWGNCQFNDCQHDRDKGCAIRGAVEDGAITQERYQRFLKLTKKMLK